MDSWNCGPHMLEFEAPDLFHCHVHGSVEEDQAREAVRIATEECARRGVRMFFVVHLENAGSDGSFTSGARKYLGTTMFDWKAILVVGGNPIMRVAAMVMARAHALLASHVVPTAMVKSVDAANEYIELVRAKETRQNLAAPAMPREALN